MRHPSAIARGARAPTQPPDGPPLASLVLGASLPPSRYAHPPLLLSQTTPPVRPRRYPPSGGLGQGHGGAVAGLPAPLGAAPRSEGRAAPRLGNHRTTFFQKDSQHLEPTSAYTERPSKTARREQYQIRDWYRHHAVSERVRTCGRVRYQAEHADVRVYESEAGERSASWHGVRLCESAWSCYHCAMTLRRKRARGLRGLAELARDEGLALTMLSFTIRHDRDADLRRMRKGMARAYASLLRKPIWQYANLGNPERFAYVRALEVTYGAHGWHPHYHVMTVSERAYTPQERAVLHDVLTGLWRKAVARYLGPEYVPSMKRAVDVSPMHHAEYLSKLDVDTASLELTDAGDGKTGHGSVKPSQLMAAAYTRTTLVVGKRGQVTITPEQAYTLTREYERAMHGARLHTCTPGLMWLMDGLGRHEEGGLRGAVRIPAIVFDTIRRIPDALLSVVEVAEGPDALEAVAQRLREIGSVRVRSLVRWEGADGGRHVADFGFFVDVAEHAEGLVWVGADGSYSKPRPVESGDEKPPKPPPSQSSFVYADA